MNNNSFSFSDLLNESNAQFDTINISNLTVDNAVITNLSPNEFVGSDSTQRLVSRGITGTSNQIIVSSGINGVTLSTPQDIDTTSNPTFNQLNLTNSISQNISGNKGWVIGSMPNQPNDYSGICHQALAGDFLNSCLQANSFGDVLYNGASNGQLVFSQGGTHRLRICPQIPPFCYLGQVEVVSSDDYIDATNSALRVNGGIYCGKKLFAGSGVLTDSVESVSNTLNIGSNTSTNTVNLACSTSVQTVNIGLGGVAQTNINIGGANDIVTIGGTLTYINTDDLKVNDRNLFLNSGGTTLTSYGAGMIFEVTGTTFAGWIRQDTVSGNRFSLKPTNNAFTLTTPVLTSNADIVTTTEPQTITALKTFSSGITSAGVTATFINASQQSRFFAGITTGGVTSTFINASQQSIFTGGVTANTVVAGGLTATTLNIPSVTASQILASDANRNIISGGFATSDINRLSTAQTIAGAKTYTLGITAVGLSRFNGGISATSVLTSGITFTGATGLTLTANTINVQGATASRFAFFDANRNLVAVNDPSTNVLTTNNTWTGTNNFTNGLTANNMFVTSTTPSKLVLTNAQRQLISSVYNDTDLVLTSTGQVIGGIKQFSSAPIVDSAGSAYVRVRITGQQGFDLYTFGDTDGFGIWSVSGGGSIFRVRSLATANRVLCSDASNYLTSTSFGPSEVLITSGNQTASGEKTFSTGIRLPTIGGTPALLDFYERWSGTFTWGTIFAVNQVADVYITRVGTMVTITMQGVLASAQTVTSGLNSTTSSGNTIPARFLGGNKTQPIQIYNGVGGGGSEVMGFWTIFQSTGAMTIKLVSGSFLTAGGVGWDMCQVTYSL